MDNRIIVAGAGPGAKEYILPIVFEEMSKCSIIIGGERNLKVFNELKINKIKLEGNYPNIIGITKKELLKGNVGFVVSGDPGFYSLLNYLLRSFNKELIKVIPGISSLQYLFSKIKMSWGDVAMQSFHGKEVDNLKEILSCYSKVAFLTDRKNSPNAIAQKIINLGLTEKKVIVGENLSYSDERISYCLIEEAIEKKFDKLSVMIVYD